MNSTTFCLPAYRVVQLNLHTGQGRWSLFTNRHELSYFQHGYYKPTMPKGDGINDLWQLGKAIGYSQEFLGDETWDRIKELTSKESLTMLGVFVTVWVGSQFTPVGWAGRLGRSRGGHECQAAAAGCGLGGGQAVGQCGL